MRMLQELLAELPTQANPGTRATESEPEISEALKAKLANDAAEKARMDAERAERLIPIYQRQIKRMNAEQGYENLDDGYECEACRNRGYIYELDGIHIVRANCKCAKARRTIRRMKASGLESIIKRYRLDNYEATDDWQKAIKAGAEAFIADPSDKWFFIGGMSGSGKSHIATAICRQLLKDQEVYYMLWEEQSVELKASVNDPDYYQDKLGKLKEVDVLYIDDFMSGRKDVGGKLALPTFADVRLAREILNHRYINRKATIISSEWFSDEIMDEIDIALGGRIIEMSKGFCFDIARDKSRNYRTKS